MNALISVVKHALMITAFVGIMTLVIEYVNVLTQGHWQERLSRRRWGQYLLAAFLGATPGCLGAFAVVAMYSHRRLSLGAVVAAIAGQMGPAQWNWIRGSLVLVSSVALFIVATVPDHFLEEHLWRHVVRGHVPRVFLWTLGALLILHLVVDRWQIDDVIQQSQWIVLGVAGLVGLV